MTGCWRFLVKDLRFSGSALCLLQGCHEKRGVRINMTNQMAWVFFLFFISVSLPLTVSHCVSQEELVGKRTSKGRRFVLEGGA